MSIRASASARKITPEKPTLLAGYHESERLSTGLRDDLYVSAVHIRAGQGGLILLSLDLYSIDPNTIFEMKKGIREATGTPEKNIFIGTTQTHSAPVTNKFLCSEDFPSVTPDQEYLDFVINQTIQAASESAVSSRPASIASLPLESPGSGVLLIKDNSTNRILATVIVDPRLPNRLGPLNTLVSADFVGSIRGRLMKRFGGNPVVVFFPATSNEKISSPCNQNKGKDQAMSTGCEIANLIVEKLKKLSIRDFHCKATLEGNVKQIDTLQAEPETAGRVVLPITKQMIGEALYQYRRVSIQMMRIGATKLIGLPAMINPGCAMNLIIETDIDTWLAQCINGDMLGSVLDNQSDSGFKLLSKYFAPETGQLLADAAIQLAKK